VPLSGGDPKPVAWLNPDERIQCGVAPDAPCVLSRPTETGVTFYRLDENWLPEVELGHADVGNAPYRFAVSPDGRELALITWDDGARTLDLESGEWRLLCREPRLQTVTYSPDGEWLYVSHVNPFSIVRISREGEIESLWRTSPNWVWSPRLSPDGTRLAFGKREIDEDAWMIEEF
jgi:WD40 repeat protein